MWLEKGNSSAGLEHIINGNGRNGFERIYYFDKKYYVLTGIGTNGFIVTAYPIEYGG